MSEANAPAGMLTGVRVVEFEGRLATPIIGMLMAEQGAEVVRVADPTRPPDDPVLDAILGRGKTDAPFDLSTAEGRAALLELLTRCDVALTDASAQRLAALGVDFDALRAGPNPGLIDCAVPAFPTGDDRAALPDHDALAGGAAALFEKAFGKPVYHDLPIPTVLGGLFAGSATMAALISRLETGRGQHVEATRFGAGLFSQILLVLMKSGVPRGFMPLKMSATPFMRSWKCRDGRWVYLHITLPAHNALILQRLEALGHGAEVAELRAVLSPQTTKDPSQVGSIPEAKAIIDIYTRIFAQRTADEWEDLVGRDLCCIKIRTIDEWLVDSLAAGMDDACRIDDPVFGPIVAPGTGITSPDVPQVARPRQTTPEALDALIARWNATPPAADRAPGAPLAPSDAPVVPPLSGFRVADMSRIIAGPCAARILAELGADVVSVGNPSSLDWALSFHLLFNAGKRSVAIDSTTAEGKAQVQAVLDRLSPHALIQNYRHLDIARQVGIDPDAMRPRHPGLVYTHLNAYGDRGVWKDRPGFEQIVQAVSGIQVAYGPPGVPKLLPTPVIDIGSGLSGALATLFGLYHRQRTGQGALVTTHLTWVAVLLQVTRVADSQRDQALAAARARGHEVAFDPSRTVVGGIARARDGFVAVAGPRADLDTWIRHLAPAAPVTKPDGRLPELPSRLRRMDADEWQRTIAQAGVSATVGIVRMPRMKNLPQSLARHAPGLPPAVALRDYDGCSRRMTFQPLPFSLSRTPRVAVDPPPQRGAHTRSVLVDAGYEVPEGTGVTPYPTDPPLLPWLWTVVRWGWFAYRWGSF